jgi:TolC family type I secretion outer membrane protein
MIKLLPLVIGIWMIFPIGDARGQTLEEALGAAYLNNPALRAARASLRAVDEQVPQAVSNWRPTLDVTGDVERSDTFANVRTGGSGGQDQIRSPRGVSLNLTQPLFRGFRTEAATRQAENAVKAERARLLSTEQNTLLAAATAFMDVLRDQAVLELNINNEQVLQRQLEAAQDRFQVGEVTRTDVSQATARLAGARADRIQAEGDLEISRAAYRNVVGRTPEKLTVPAMDGNLPAGKEKAMGLSEANHPDVIATLFDEKAARDAIDEVRGELLPTVNLTGTMNRRFESFNNTSRADERAIGANVTVPLYQSGAVYSRLREAKQTAGQRRLLVNQSRRDVVERATRGWESLMTARARVKSFQAQVDANKIALEGVQREAEVGARTVLDILDAEQELLDASVNLVGAQRDEVVATFELKEAIGELTARHLNLPIEFYDPERHYREVQGKWFGGSSTADVEQMDGAATPTQ